MTEKFNPIKESYSNHVCPDCSNDIPTNVADGESCLNCGHVFVSQSDDDDDDDEIDAWMDSLPEPTYESELNYQRQSEYMMKINQEAGVFQDIECHTAQDPIDNNKYIESIYTWQHSPDVN